MSQFFSVHPEQPQARLIHQAVEIMKKGGLVVFPTDSAYALGGQLGDAALLERIRRIRGVDERHTFTLMCHDLSEVGTYARVDNSQYRLLKAITPGAYTIVLEGSKELPRRVLHRLDARARSAGETRSGFIARMAVEGREATHA